MSGEFEKRFITVAELIKQLQEQPQDAEVYSEGCDCIGGSSGCELYTPSVPPFEKPYVIINRAPGQ